MTPRCEHFYGTHTDRQCLLPATFGEYCRQHYEVHVLDSPDYADDAQISCLKPEQDEPQTEEEMK